jgi:hypothetical protein
MIAWGSAAVAQSVAVDEAPADFRSLLLDAGFNSAELAAFADWNGDLSEAQAEVASRLLFRLRAAGDGGRASDRVDGEPGRLVEVEGRAISAEPVAVPAVAQEVFAVKQLTVCTVKLSDDSTVAVLSVQIPVAWSRRPAGTPLDEPVSLRGVFLGTANVAGSPQPLVLTPRLQWFPDANVSDGVAWLVKHGFDAALLDEIRHGRPFAKLGEGLEAQAFYDGLTIMANSSSAELTRLARDRIPEVARHAKQAAAQRERQITSLLNAAAPDDTRSLRPELWELQRQQALAKHVMERAERGLSSVWPMFLEPDRNTGDTFLIEGTARRAVRIVVESPSSESEALPGLREYYELDVFTTDSQNQPVVCCVARLPAGFPTGELIREPVRVAGIFFKKWAYARRSDEGETGDDHLPARLAPPLMLAAEPEWLQTAAPAGPSHRGLWGGAAFAGVVAFLWIVLARVSRRDRLARAQRARYDASLENLAEP